MTASRLGSAGAEDPQKRRRAPVLPIGTRHAGAPPPAPTAADDAATLAPIRFLTVKQVAARLDISVRTVWRDADNDPAFPQPRKVGKRNGPRGRMQSRRTRWVEAEVDDYVRRIAQGELSR